MSTELDRISERPNVIPFLEKSIENQRNQLVQSEAILSHIRQIEASVTEKAMEVEQIKSDIELLAKEIHDENRLLPAEIDDLYNAVVAKSIQAARHERDESDEEFTKVIGRIRRRIWSEMKKRFGASKYIHIRRKDYQGAMDFVKSFKMSDYV